MDKFPATVAHLEALAVDSYAFAFRRKPEVDAFSGDFLDRFDDYDFTMLRTKRAYRAGWPLYEIDLGQV